MHALLIPAIRLMNRLSFAKKFGLVSLVFLLSILVLSASLVRDRAHLAHGEHGALGHGAAACLFGDLLPVVIRVRAPGRICLRCRNAKYPMRGTAIPARLLDFRNLGV